MKPVEIDAQYNADSVAFLADGEHIIGGGENRRIRRWRVKDGKEVGTPMYAGRPVTSIAVSRDGKWIVSGTDRGEVAVWDAETHKKVSEFSTHGDKREKVNAVDVSPDATRIATASGDGTLCLWSLLICERLLAPFKHGDRVHSVKFSPNGCLIATATPSHQHYKPESAAVRVYNGQNGSLLADIRIPIWWGSSEYLFWRSDSKQLLVFSSDGSIHHLDVFTRRTLSKWIICSNDNPASDIALQSDGSFIVAFGGSSLSFWDIVTHEQIGPVIQAHHSSGVFCMRISANYDLAIVVGGKITLRNIRHILPSSYIDDDRVSALASSVLPCSSQTHLL